MQEKKFTLGGTEYTAKELTIGQFKKVKMLLDGNDEVGASSLMVAYSINKDMEFIESLPMSEMENVGKVSEWLGSIVSPS